MRYQTGRYGYVALALADDNVIKTREALNSAKPTIMPPKASLIPPAPRPGYSQTVLPTWCSFGEVCDGIVSTEYQKRMGTNLPPRDRGTTVTDPEIAQLS